MEMEQVLEQFHSSSAIDGQRMALFTWNRKSKTGVHALSREAHS